MVEHLLITSILLAVTFSLYPLVRDVGSAYWVAWAIYVASLITLLLLALVS